MIFAMIFAIVSAIISYLFLTKIYHVKSMKRRAKSQ